MGICIVGFAGISLAVSGGDGTTGQAAQTPLGEESAPNSGAGVQDEVLSGGQTPNGSAPTKASSPGSGTAPVQVSGGGSKSLPFTGLLVIPVLLAGLALLGTGLVLRRREFSAVRS
jgi:hypothetical protein